VECRPRARNFKKERLLDNDYLGGSWRIRRGKYLTIASGQGQVLITLYTGCMPIAQ